MSIHVYYSDGDSDNLGLVRIIGSCTSGILLQMVEDKLKDFGLNIAKNIITITRDGASVIWEFITGRLTSILQSRNTVGSNVGFLQ